MQATANDVWEKPVYTPKFSAETSNIIRRLAWSINKPMTKTVEMLVMALPAIIDPTKICLSCKDRTDCKACLFSRHFTTDEKSALLKAL
ncbi:hypothetical protein [Treponema sp. R80B11-R83G3]